MSDELGFLNTNQAAAILGLKPYRIRAFCRKRQLEHVRIGGSILISKAAIERFIEEHRVIPLKPPCEDPKLR